MHTHTPDGVLLVDKPAGITSTRALALAKRALDARKAGHTGTLDPFATGLLPLVFGEATKFSRFLLDSEKRYEATLRLGEETPSGDTETEPIRIAEVIPKIQRIDEILAKFTGDLRQIPPMHSAVHVNGRRLYEYAREGIELAREPRQVHISALDRVHLTGRDLVVSVVCSKGTYIRVLATDIGRALGCGAYLVALRRTAVGRFEVADALDPEGLAALGCDAARARLLPTETLVWSIPRRDLDPEASTRFGQGQALKLPALPANGPVAVFAPGGRFMGVGESAGESLAPLRLMASVTESP